MLLSLALGCKGEVQQPVETVQRVVSTVPSVTDLIVAMGERERLVARTRYDQDALAQLPSVGGTFDPSLEIIATLEPDLVIVGLETRDDLVTDPLRRVGLRVERVRSASFEDLSETLTLLGNWFGAPDAARRLSDRISDSLNAVRLDYSESSLIPVMYVVSITPPMTAGGDTFISNVIEIAGGRNIFADAAVKWPPVGMESIFERDPEYLILPSARPDDDLLAELRRTPGWQDLGAVRGGRVFVVDRDLFSRPGPRLGEAARLLGTLLHPESE